MLRLRSALREFFPAALEAFSDLTAPDALELLGRTPDPARAAELSRAKIAAALRRAGRRDPEARAVQIQQALRAPSLRQPPAVESAYAVIVVGQVRLIAALNSEVEQLGEVVAAHFGEHPDAEIYASQPGLGVILSARVLAEFGDAPGRFTDARARKNARNRRLGDAVHQRAFCALKGSPGARACYTTLRAGGIGHQAALRQLGNRLVGILHGCLKTRAPYDEETAWQHHLKAAA